MRTRAYQTLVPLLVILGVLSVSGCKLLKKKKAPDGDGTVGGSFNDVDAFNKADVSRFTDERRLFNESGFVRVISFARTAPDSGGTIVAVIDADTLVVKHAERFGNTLISFNRSAFPGKRFAGWVPNSAFLFPVATPPPSTGTCSLTLRQSGFSPSRSSCSFNESVRAGSPATLFFPCTGGFASARFGAQTFVGTGDPNKVSLTNTATSTSQGCTIRTTQTITGTPPLLTYFLSETIVGGSCKNVITCTARANISALR